MTHFSILVWPAIELIVNSKSLLVDVNIVTFKTPGAFIFWMTSKPLNPLYWITYIVCKWRLTARTNVSPKINIKT